MECVPIEIYFKNSFSQWGLVSSDSRTFHNQLRNFVQNQTWLDDVVVDDQTSVIQAFNPDHSEELREGHLELMDNGEVLSSEDDD